MRSFILAFVLLISALNFAQETNLNMLPFAEYMGYVKAYHPLVKQANLQLSEGQAKLMKARGAFDPKLEVDYARKKFKDTEYFDKLNATFKIPTWYGVELKANFEENEGAFLNPEANLPEDGLYSVGVSVALAKGLLINQRMAVLKQAKLFTKQMQAEQQLAVNNTLYQAALAYFKWLRHYNEKQVYTTFLQNAQIRFNAVKKSFENGDKPAVDTLEAYIAVSNRKLDLEKATITYTKATLAVSNYLWLENNVPVELAPNVIPENVSENQINNTLQVSEIAVDTFSVDEHPKIRTLDFKYKNLTIEKRLMLNNLLPEVNLEYNFLSETPEAVRSFSTSAYKSGLSIRFPIFLRKERANLKLANLKLRDTEFAIAFTKTTLQNKLNAVSQELSSLKRQNKLVNTIVLDYEQLLKAEERKFSIGESSLFLVNSREVKLIEAKLKALQVQNMLFDTKAKLFNTMATQINP